VIGAGVVIAGSSVLLWRANETSDDVQSLPPGTAWSSDLASGAFERAKTEQTLALVGFAVGGALATEGVIVLTSMRGRTTGVAVARLAISETYVPGVGRTRSSALPPNSFRSRWYATPPIRDTDAVSPPIPRCCS
jgi:hypothetical protein